MNWLRGRTGSAYIRGSCVYRVRHYKVRLTGFALTRFVFTGFVLTGFIQYPYTDAFECLEKEAQKLEEIRSASYSSWKVFVRIFDSEGFCPKVSCWKTTNRLDE